MTSLEKEHEPYFSHDEQLQLLTYKHNFVKSILFWTEEGNMTDEQKMSRIGWEYNNMFELLSGVINNNVEQYDMEDIEDEQADADYQDPNKDF